MARNGYGREEAMQQFILMMRQWQTNAETLYKHSRKNQKVQEMCQALSIAMESIEGWCELPGSVMLIAAYQPGMFDDDEFDRAADWMPD